MSIHNGVITQGTREGRRELQETLQAERRVTSGRARSLAQQTQSEQIASLARLGPLLSLPMSTGHLEESRCAMRLRSLRAGCLVVGVLYTRHG
jgi:hypothetical protein